MAIFTQNLYIVSKPLNKIVNPFEDSVLVEYVEVIEEVKHGEITKSYKYEAESYTRIYNNRPKREFIFSLSMWARDLILMMQYWVQSNNKHVILPYERVKEMYNTDPKYGKRRYDETIRELIRHSIIDYKDKEIGDYWYNHKVFASGNRISMYPTNTRRARIVDNTHKNREYANN